MAAIYYDGPEPCISEAIKGLCAAKLELIKSRDALREQGMWCKFDQIWNQYTTELAEIDRRIDALTERKTKP